MPQLAEILNDLVESNVKRADESEKRRLLAHVKAIRELAGEEPGIDELQALFEAGWLPTYQVEDELHVDAQLAMSTTRERKIDAGGTVSFGPIAIQGTLSNSFGQGTQTNVAVSVVLKRRSISEVLSLAREALAAGAGA